MDWPLAICDGSSVNFRADTIPADIVYPNWVTENVQVHYNEAQRWYYLPKQMPSEVLVFTSAHSDDARLEGKESSLVHSLEWLSDTKYCRLSACRVLQSDRRTP